jgi:hypothetical protein
MARLCPQCAEISRALVTWPKAIAEARSFNWKTELARRARWEGSSIRPRYAGCSFANFDPAENPRALEVCRRYARRFRTRIDWVEPIFWSDEGHDAEGNPIFELGVEVDPKGAEPRRGTSGGLILMGPVGTGKTHLAVSIMRARMIGDLVSAIELLDAILKSYRTHETCTQLETARHSELLTLDDLGAEAKGEWAGREILELIGYRYEYKLPVIVTTNASMSMLKSRLGARTVSRLAEMCEVVPLRGSDHRLRRGAS